MTKKFQCATYYTHYCGYGKSGLIWNSVLDLLQYQKLISPFITSMHPWTSINWAVENVP